MSVRSWRFHRHSHIFQAHELLTQSWDTRWNVQIIKSCQCNHDTFIDISTYSRLMTSSCNHLIKNTNYLSEMSCFDAHEDFIEVFTWTILMNSSWTYWHWNIYCLRRALIEIMTNSLWFSHITGSWECLAMIWTKMQNA